MTLLDALELVASLVPGLGPAVRAIRLLRIAVRIAELVRKVDRGGSGRAFSSHRTGDSIFSTEEAAELDRALEELEAEEGKP